MLAAVLFLVLTTLLISVEFLPREVNLQVGQPSPETVKAPRTIVFEDKDKTRLLQEEAAAAVPKQYDRFPQVNAAVQKNVSGLLEKVKKIVGDENLKLDEKIDQLRQVFPFSLPDNTLKSLAEAAPESSSQALDEVEAAVNGLIGEVMESEEGVTEENLEETKIALAKRIGEMNFNQQYEILAEKIIQIYLKPNSFYNAEKTQQKKEAARDAVIPVQVTVKQGEKIVGEGEIVTKEHMLKLQALGLTRSQVPISKVAGNFVLVVLLTGIVLYYLYQQNREIFEAAGHVYLIGLVVLFILLIGKAIVAINVSQWPALGALLGYMVPIAAAGMLIAILLDSRLAVLVVAIMSLLLAVMTGNQLRFGLVGFIGGITGIYSVSKLSQRSDLAKAGAYTSAANVAAILTMGLITGTSPALLVTSSLLLGIVNGLLSSVLTNGFLPYLENAFKITSPVRLLELSNPGNPLLKKLLTEAPGTYHHSIIVGNLAEAAADVVGGDSLLVRVGAYYHDIGKIKRPYFFIENQLYGENPHNKIAPSLSTLILTSHVKDGVEMAKEYHLPQAIIDIIEQHHGNSLVSFFYHKAREGDRGEAVSEEEFRYEGPKPQSREAAIVMLADTVEAAVRSLQNPTPGRIEGMVRKIIKEKLMDGQLDESDLTFKDLNRIGTAFVKVLSGIFHMRVEYPEIDKEMERGKSRRDDTRKESARKNPG